MLNWVHVEETLADAVLNRPQEFFIDGRKYEIWMPTLGMTILIERLKAQLDFNEKRFLQNPGLEALRLCETNKELVCSILSIYTLKTFEKLCDSKIRRDMEKELSSLSTEELAQLFLFVLTAPNAEIIISHSNIIKDQQIQAKIAKLKNKDSHTQTFGGKTIFGSIIDAACSKYGWTKEYVVWGIDLISLRLMMADSINTVYLTDDELKVLKIPTESNQKFGMKKEDIEKLKAMDWS